MEQMITKLVLENQVILLDTSVAMDEKFEDLVNEMELLLMENRKKIVVKNAVWAELLRHLGSDDEIKQQRATKAVEIIGMHQNIFDINGWGLSSDKIFRSFADAEFLADLTRHKNRYTQALLTNDKKLSRDVNNLNSQESYLGKQISVYSLNNGNIVLCPCEEKEVSEPEKIIIKEKVKENNSILPIVGSTLTALTAGVFIGKYSKNILKMLKIEAI